MKKFIFSAAILGLVAPIALATTSASADGILPDGQHATTTADVTFTGSAFPTPVGPVNPTNPTDPTNPDNPGTPTNPTNNPDQPINPNPTP